ncbi:uncharacterized protein LOC114180647 [Vigna unguiculata]|uniref:uncharacterized protein LOC114180647 n=1 Tax=Vigna unguiculata TaxID=3917 RepID=UPI001016BA8D|nr:uncharacterized protein LOC114180647 [Vigna unguiculata]
MEFRVGGNLGSDALKKKLPIKVIDSNLSGLREIVQQMKTIQKNAFKKRHGNLLRLLNAEFQASAVTTLAQYYDPPLRCFTFQDFQLVPTIEEFEQILGLSMEDKVPYRHSEQHASVSTLAGILKVHPAKLEGKMASKGNSKGIPQGYLEGHLRLLAEKEMGETFMNVLALTLYGVILFPNMENFVDQTALDVFVAYKIHSESPVTAVLADVHGSTLNVECLIGELPPSGIEIRGAKEWAQFCASLNVGKIRWCVPGLSKSRVISCGAFPNVPLIGTRSCVNYNPVLAQRQFGCPIKSSPTLESLVAVWTYYEEGISLDLIRRIRSAWGEVLRVEKDPRPWVIDEKISYRRWILERVNTVKLPFKSDSPAPERSEPAESEEMKRLKEEMEKMKLKNAKLINELQSLRHEYVNLRRDKEEMTKAYEGILRKQ